MSASNDPSIRSEAILFSIRYQEIASILRATDHPKFDKTPPALQSHSASMPTPRTQSRKHLSPPEFADLKSKSTFHKCGRKGLWASDKDKCLGNDNGMTSPTAKPSFSSTGSSSSGGQRKVGTVTFHMPKLLENKSYITNTKSAPGPLVDDGAPYSGLGLVELRTFARNLLPQWKGELDPLPNSVVDTPFWQYGSGSHASPKRAILGSILIPAYTTNGNVLQIRHLVIDGSSQWVIRRNVTRKSNIIHRGGNLL